MKLDKIFSLIKRHKLISIITVLSIATVAVAGAVMISQNSTKTVANNSEVVTKTEDKKKTENNNKSEKVTEVSSLEEPTEAAVSETSTEQQVAVTETPITQTQQPAAEPVAIEAPVAQPEQRSVCEAVNGFISNLRTNYGYTNNRDILHALSENSLYNQWYQQCVSTGEISAL